MTLDEMIERIALDQAQHMTGGPSTPADLQQLEERLSISLPDAYRVFHARLGAGIYYQHHEMFGCRRVMIHDIELVPDIVSMQRLLARQNAPPPAGLFPLHRGAGILHLIDLNPGPQRGMVVRVPEQASYPDLAAFLEAIVLP
jgi:hypothetical protein